MLSWLVMHTGRRKAAAKYLNGHSEGWSPKHRCRFRHVSEYWNTADRRGAMIGHARLCQPEGTYSNSNDRKAQCKDSIVYSVIEYTILY